MRVCTRRNTSGGGQAFALGHAAVTQDVDVVWKQDVFLYLRRAAERWNVSLALTPDAPIASGKVGKRDSPAVNGGFLFVAEPVAFRKARRKSASSKVLHGYAQKCHEILEARRNQHLLARTLATAGLSIVREADFLRAARPDERERVLLLEPSQFANGYPLLTLHASLSDVTFYHANFATTWAQKCSKLAATRSLFVSPNAADARCRCESRVPCHAPRAPFFNSNPTADDRAYADFVKSITSSTRAPCPDITNTTAPPGKAPPANGARTSTPPPLTDSRH